MGVEDRLVVLKQSEWELVTGDGVEEEDGYKPEV